MSSGNIDGKSLINVFGGDKRRTSQSSGSPTSPTKYSGLHDAKRGGSLDASAQARRESRTEQYNKPGFIGTMWNKYAPGRGASTMPA